MKAKEGHGLTLQSKEGNGYRPSSSFVKLFQLVLESKVLKKDTTMPSHGFISDVPARPFRMATPGLMQLNVAPPGFVIYLSVPR